jgi:hypothetical protein
VLTIDQLAKYRLFRANDKVYIKCAPFRLLKFYFKICLKGYKMDTLTIKVRDSKTLKLIRDLESLNLIQVVNNPQQKPAKKLSAEITGGISEEQANSMRKELQQIRNEWERDIY